MAVDPRRDPFGVLGSQNIPAYTFPTNDPGQYKGKIRFEAVQENTSTVSQAVIDTFTGARAALDNTNPNDSTATDITGSDPSLQTYNSGLPDVEPKGAVSLFLPSSILFSDRVNYQDIDLGIVGSAVAGGIERGDSLRNLARAGFNAVYSDFKSLQDAVTKGLTGEAAQVAAIRTSRRINSEVAGAISSATGIALNPNKRSILESVPIRSFQFSFKLIPTSSKEAADITNIVRWFREQMYPEAVSTGSIAFRFPSKFNISMTYNGKKVATGILPCFLESVSTTYNGSSMGFHRDGNFQETDVVLVFREERALNKRDIRGGY